ncbi:MAG: ParB N-terminal domain-containing protein [Planctomycetes bacterium]|nr:ParB N-terminal domain-containing protein [Planctomycetota bacterium]
MGQVRIAFETQARLLPVASILPVRAVPDSIKKSRKYEQIVSSIQELGMIEPLVVYPQKGTRGEAARYVLLDGHLRHDALKAMGRTEVLCLVSTDDEGFTYNHKVSQISAIQEHFMLLKALDSGVSEERMAKALSLDVAAIRNKRDLLEGICAEAVALLRNHPVRPGALREIRRAAPMRQMQMAELMISSRNFTVAYAKCLIAATAQKQLVDQASPKEVKGLTPEDIARMERETQTLETDFRGIEKAHGQNVLKLVVAVGYVRRLLDSAAVVKYLSRKCPDLLAELGRIVETVDLTNDAPDENPQEQGKHVS